MRGIEIDGFAVRLARVTLWMGHKLAIDELEIDESTLPLADLSGIGTPTRCACAGRARMRSSGTRRSTAPSTCAGSSATSMSSG
jgi:hypothetical protein